MFSTFLHPKPWSCHSVLLEYSSHLWLNELSNSRKTYLISIGESDRSTLENISPLLVFWQLSYTTLKSIGSSIWVYAHFLHLAANYFQVTLCFCLVLSEHIAKCFACRDRMVELNSQKSRNEESLLPIV